MKALEWVSLENPVAIWWIFLSSVALVNVVFLIWLRTLVFTKPSIFSRTLYTLGAVYTLGCAYRSFFPKADVQRIALFDTWLSSVFLGRTVATFAELAFVAQWALILMAYGKATESRKVRFLASLILPTIVVAEVCSWYAVITTNYIGNTIEESLWAFCYVFIGVGLASLQSSLSGYLRLAARLGVFGCVLYVGFMTLVDVPMYYQRWLADLASQKEFFSLWDGLVDLNTRWHVTHAINDWRQEIPWMSLYFSFAVWVSLALILVPDPKKKT